MLHLINDIRADYRFTGLSVGRPEDRFIQFGEESDSYPYLHPAPVPNYPSLKEGLAEYGDLVTLIETLLPLSGDTYLMVEVEDMYRLLVTHALSINPQLSETMVHRLVRAFYIHHRYVRANGFTYDADLRALPTPQLEQVRGWMAEAAVGAGYSGELRAYLGYEFLLAHALAVDFDPEDRYVQSLTRKVDHLLWVATARDYVQGRMTLLYNAPRLKKDFGIPIDPEREDIDRQFQRTKVREFFNVEVSYKDLSYVRQNFRQITRIMNKIDQLSGQSERLSDAVRETLNPDRPLTSAEVKALIELDRSHAWSLIFGREKVTEDTNTVFIGYLYQAPVAELQELRLDRAD